MQSDLPVRQRTTENTDAVDPQPTSVDAIPTDEEVRNTIDEYLSGRSEEFRNLSELRKKVSPQPDPPIQSHVHVADGTTRLRIVLQPTSISLSSARKQMPPARSVTSRLRKMLKAKWL